MAGRVNKDSDPAAYSTTSVPGSDSAPQDRESAEGASSVKEISTFVPATKSEKVTVHVF